MLISVLRLSLASNPSESRHELSKVSAFSSHQPNLMKATRKGNSLWYLQAQDSLLEMKAF
ncbi:hypothetical protein COLO4_35847 [Corchorus olitorius]|uniref:Uncharacterized protein n=1 Tax=Corchorus olitorius TaxID=93759 RepID=A0A1R3GCQ9_9ROSI|nr:hypothetical protein COLO4_35847 [Corchorus olitorius]